MPEDEAIKEMASMLRSGAVMLAEQCPNCGGLLFRLKNGEKVCPRCAQSENIKEGSHVETKFKTEDDFALLERSLLSKLPLLSTRITGSSDTAEIAELVHLCNDIILALEKIRDLRKR